MINPFRHSPRISWSIADAIVGILVGLFVIGNFGIASGGHGYGVWGWVIGGVSCAYIGFRIGEWRRRRAATLSH
jgi:hypothetical protein